MNDWIILGPVLLLLFAAIFYLGSFLLRVIKGERLTYPMPQQPQKSTVSASESIIRKPGKQQSSMWSAVIGVIVGVILLAYVSGWTFQDFTDKLGLNSLGPAKQISPLTYGGLMSSLKSLQDQRRDLTNVQFQDQLHSFYGVRVRWYGWVSDVQKTSSGFKVSVDMDAPDSGWSVDDLLITAPKLPNAIELQKDQIIVFEGNITNISHNYFKFFVELDGEHVKPMPKASANGQSSSRINITQYDKSYRQSRNNSTGVQFFDFAEYDGPPLDTTDNGASMNTAQLKSILESIPKLTVPHLSPAYRTGGRNSYAIDLQDGGNLNINIGQCNTNEGIYFCIKNIRYHPLRERSEQPLDNGLERPRQN
jgi:hypothetical protein